ncbi:unnamed protein product [Alternaria alternata]
MSLKTWRKKILQCVKVAFPFHAAAWKALSEPIQRMLEEPDYIKQDQLTASWKEGTQSQLNVISVTSALFGAVIATSYTWPALTQLSQSDQSTVLMIWYSALLLALAAIATSAQQSVALTRLGSHPDGLCKIRQLIGKRDGLTKFKARKSQLFIWQAPLSLLNTSVVMFIIGFAVLVWKAALPIPSGDNVKVLVLFMLTLSYITSLYMIPAYGLY